MRSSVLAVLLVLALASGRALAQQDDEPFAQLAADAGFVLAMNVEAVADVKLSSTAGISGATCINMCATNDQCSSFTYVLQNGECTLMGSPVEELQRVEEGLRSSVGIKPTATSCHRASFTRNENMDSPGHNFFSADGIQPGKCEELCASFEQCEGAVYVTSPDVRCFLKSHVAVDHMTTLPGRQSGFLTVKTCEQASSAAEAAAPHPVKVGHVQEAPVAAPAAEVEPASPAEEQAPAEESTTEEADAAADDNDDDVDSDDDDEIDEEAAPATTTAADDASSTTTPAVSSTAATAAAILAATSADNINPTVYQNMLAQYTYGAGKAACLATVCNMPTSVKTKEALDAYVRGNTQCNPCLIKYWMTCRLGCHKARSRCSWVPAVASFGCVPM